jgi:hypothetical protein
MAKKSSSSKSTKSNSSDIQFIRLTNGEDIIAEIIDISYGKVTVSNPLKVVYSTSMKPGYLTMSLMQWVFLRLSKNQTFTMDETNILIQSEPEDALLNHYHSSVGALVERSNTNFEFANYTDDSDIDLDNDSDGLNELDGLELLKELLSKSKKDKGNLH